MSEIEREAKQISEEVQRPLLEQINESQTFVPSLSDEELEEIAGGSTLSIVGRFVGEHKPLVAGSVAMVSLSVVVPVTVYGTK